MYNAGYLSAVLIFNRDAVTPVPHGDEGILQVILCGRGQDAGELGPDTVSRNTDAPADLPKGRRSRVADLFFGDDTAADFCGFLRTGLQGREHLREDIVFLALTFPARIRADERGVFQQACDLQKLVYAKGAADLKPLQGSPDVERTAEGDVSLLQYARNGRLGFTLEPFNLRKRRGGRQFEAAAPARL